MSAMVVSYDTRYRDEVVELIGGSAMRTTLWDWQFERNPRGVPFEPVLVVDDDGRVAGFNGVMPVRVRYQGTERLACWSCDFHVHQRHRGTGVGRLVKEALHDRQPLLMTFGVSPIAMRVLSHLGWKQGRGVYSYRSLRRTATTRDLGLRAVQLANRFAVARTWKGRRDADDLVVELQDNLPPASEVDALWTRVGATHDSIVCRDHAYLDWRYAQCPAGGYRYITLGDAPGLRALAVYRTDGHHSRLVDLVVAAEDDAARFAAVRAWLSVSAGTTQLHVTTSDRVLGQVLKAAGFYRARNQPAFFVRSASGEPDAAEGWFIMGGDSDGEFLHAARESGIAGVTSTVDLRVEPAGADQTEALIVRLLGIRETCSTPDAWNALVARSDADPLFMGWAWQSAWWETWGERLELEPCILGVYRGSRLIGMAPLYRSAHRRMGSDVVGLHFIGNAWRIAPTVRTEYVDVIAEVGFRNAVTEALETHLQNDNGWDLLTICDHVGMGPFPRLQTDERCIVVPRKADFGVAIDTTGQFGEWLKTLGPNTRLKAYNRRRYLEGNTTLTYRAEEDFERAFELLNAFHRKRWGKACFEGASLAFHRQFLARFQPDREVRFSVLEVGGQPRSILYDVRVGQRLYNLQAGFEERFDPKVSLGTLHLGYAIEAAFEDDRVSAYDLLAGSGKKTQYKQRLGGTDITFNTFQIVRNPVLRIAYGTYARMPESFQRQARRWFSR